MSSQGKINALASNLFTVIISADFSNSFHSPHRMGAGELDYSQFSQQCDLYTGQFSMAPIISPDHTLQNDYFEEFLCSCYCMEYNIDKMLSLWKDVFLR